jgi:hypothetical protein
MTDVPLPQRAFIAGVIDVLGDRTVVVRAEPGLHQGGRLLQIQVTERKKGKEDEVLRVGDRVTPGGDRDGLIVSTYDVVRDRRE